MLLAEQPENHPLPEEVLARSFAALQGLPKP